MGCEPPACQPHVQVWTCRGSPYSKVPCLWGREEGSMCDKDQCIRGNGYMPPPPSVNRQTRLKTLPSLNNWQGSFNTCSRVTQWRTEEFFRQETPAKNMGHQLIILVSFPRKLHENFKKIGQRWGVCPWCCPAPWILHLCSVMLRMYLPMSLSFWKINYIFEFQWISLNHT